MLFFQNLLLFVLGLGCQVLAGVFPAFGGFLLAPSSLLLSLADLKLVTDGSFAKHLFLFLLGLACQGCSQIPFLAPAKAELMTAGALLMSNSNIRRIFRGQETPAAPIVTPDDEAHGAAPKANVGGPSFPPPEFPPRKPTPSSEAHTPPETPRSKTRP